MEDCKPMSIPVETSLKLSHHDPSPQVNATFYHQLIGSLIYLTYTKPNISYAFSYLSRFMQEPKVVH